MLGGSSVELSGCARTSVWGVRKCLTGLGRPASVTFLDHHSRTQSTFVGSMSLTVSGNGFGIFEALGLLAFEVFRLLTALLQMFPMLVGNVLLKAN